MTSTAPPFDFGSWYARRTIAMRGALSEIRAEAERLTYGAGALQSAVANGEAPQDLTARALELYNRLQQLAGAALAAISADSHAEHELTEHADRTSPPYAEWRVGASRPVGLEEVARELGVRRATADQWRARGVLPEPTWMVSGSPVWIWSDIKTWARETGRLPRSRP